MCTLYYTLFITEYTFICELYRFSVLHCTTSIVPLAIKHSMTLHIMSQTHNAWQAGFQVNYVTHSVFLFFVHFDQHIVRMTEGLRGEG